MLANQIDQLVAVSGLADDLESRPLEHARQTRAQQNVVVRQYHPRATRGHVGDYGLRSHL
jgi:hypothetical protein